MKLVRFHLKSLSPGLLLNPATPELLEALRTKKPQQKKNDWTVEAEAATKLYWSEPDETTKVRKMGIPAQNMLACIVNAGREVKTGKKQISTATSSTVFGFMEIIGDFLPFEGLDDKGCIPWQPFANKGTMHAAGKDTAVCIVRPRIKHWSMIVNVRFDENRGIDDSTLVKLFDEGGRKVGLCDWRPQKKGRFGRFTVTKVESMALKDTTEATVIVPAYTAETAPEDLSRLADSLSAVAA